MVPVNREDLALQRRRLVESLREDLVIRSEKVANSFLRVPREEFVWPDTKENAYADTPLPLGRSGQTISAPHMSAIILEELDIQSSISVLEVGAGSGYNAALMAEILKSYPSDLNVGSVVTVERMPELATFASENLRRTGYSDIVKVVVGDGSLGYPEGLEEELYDRIVVTAAAPRIPHLIQAQLKTDGILLLPLGDRWTQVLEKIVKKKEGELVKTKVCGCVFVPLVGANGYSE